MPLFRNLTHVIAVVTLVPCIAQAEDAVALPTGFDGSYAVEGMACEGLGLIEVKDGILLGAEFSVTVTDLIELPGEPNKVEATLLNQAGGGEWTDSAILSLANGGGALRIDYPDGSTVVWNRCG